MAKLPIGPTPDVGDGSVAADAPEIIEREIWWESNFGQVAIFNDDPGLRYTIADWSLSMSGDADRVRVPITSPGGDPWTYLDGLGGPVHQIPTEPGLHTENGQLQTQAESIGMPVITPFDGLDLTVLVRAQWDPIVHTAENVAYLGGYSHTQQYEFGLIPERLFTLKQTEQSVHYTSINGRFSAGDTGDYPGYDPDDWVMTGYAEISGFDIYNTNPDAENAIVVNLNAIDGNADFPVALVGAGGYVDPSLLVDNQLDFRFDITHIENDQYQITAGYAPVDDVDSNPVWVTDSTTFTFTPIDGPYVFVLFMGAGVIADDLYSMAEFPFTNALDQIRLLTPLVGPYKGASRGARKRPGSPVIDLNGAVWHGINLPAGDLDVNHYGDNGIPDYAAYTDPLDAESPVRG